MILLSLRRSAAVFAVGALAATLACEAGTGGRRAHFDLAVATAGAATFRTSTGWDVTLESACISLGPLYLFAEPSVTAKLQRRAYDLLVPTAHAHPGVDHFYGGEVRGEWLDQIVVNAVDPTPVELGAFEGIAGDVRSATLGVYPPKPTIDAPCLRGHHAYVVGVARQADRVIAFEGGLDIEAVGDRRRVAIATTLLVDDGERVVVSVDPRPWLDQAKFEELAVDEASGRAQITAESQASLAWQLGIHTAGAFAVLNAPPAAALRNRTESP